MRILAALRSKNAAHVFILVVVIAINLAFGLPRLGTYSAVDEPYWTFERTPDFWRAVRSAKWKNTDINDKPGITVAELSGFGLLKIDPMPYKPLREEPKTPQELAAFDTINIAFRLPLYLFSLLALPVFYLLIRAAIGATVAIFSTILIGLSPILLGMSLIINPDSLLFIFLPIAILARLASGTKSSRKYLIIAGISTGLSLLTKYVANILFVFFLLFPFLEYLFAEKKPDPQQFLKNTLRDLFILVLVSILTFTLLYPATWVKPEMILEGTLLSAAFKSTWPLFAGVILFLLVDAFLLRGVVSERILRIFSRFRSTLSKAILGIFFGLILLTLANTWLGMRWFDLEAFVMSPKNSEASATLLKNFGSLLADVYSLIFGIHPIALFLLLGTLGTLLFFKHRFGRYQVPVLAFTFFILLYYLGSTANYVIATVRYQIALFPLAFILSGIGAAILLEFLSERCAQFHSTRLLLARVFLPGLLILILAANLVSVRPHYLASASSLLPKRFILNFKDMGDGSYEAAQFLNALPDARNIRVWSDKGAVCAAFIGDCSVSFNQKRFKENIPDYVVLSTGRKRKTVNMWLSTSVPINFKDAYEKAPAEFTEILGNRSVNFVKVIRVDRIFQEEQ